MLVPLFSSYTITLSPSAPDRAQPVSLALPCPADDVDLFLSEPTTEVVQSLAGMTGPILVLGAGGKMGLHLCLMLRRAMHLLSRSDAVVAVSRFSTLRDRAIFEQHGIKTQVCDLADEEQLAVLPSASTVFFLAGAKFGTDANAALLHRANVEVPQKVAARFRTARIIAFSTGCVYPFVPIASGGATEVTRPQPVGAYAESCLAREQAFSDAAAHHGTRVVLIRLNYSVEFRYGVLVDVAQKILAGQPVDVTTGHFNAIWQRDAVAHIIQSWACTESPAVPLNITGQETLSVREVARHFGKLLGRRVEFTGQESATAWLNNATRSHRRFGPPPTTPEQMMAWIAAWLTRGGSTWGKPTAFENREGRF